jgi:hypothetical protein
VLAERAAAGDIWLPDGSRVDLQRSVVIGSRLDVLTPERDTDEPVVATRFHRQSLIFVATGQAILGGAKVGIVGAGGVGMLLVQSLARTVLSVKALGSQSISVWPGVRRIPPRRRVAVRKSPRGSPHSSSEEIAPCGDSGRSQHY